jgi:hypothetical protein
VNCVINGSVADFGRLFWQTLVSFLRESKGDDFFRVVTIALGREHVRPLTCDFSESRTMRAEHVSNMLPVFVQGPRG